MNNESVRSELSNQLLHQQFSKIDKTEPLLNQYKKMVKNYAQIDNSICVLSDLKNNRSYVYAGAFALFFGLSSKELLIPSAFEDIIFNKIHPDDLVARHQLELQFIEFQKKQPQKERPKFNTNCRLRACEPTGGYTYITHRTVYPESTNEGIIFFAICIYSPSSDQEFREGIDGKIVNNETGEIVSIDETKPNNPLLISRRENEILVLIAQGLLSKQIAFKLHIALSTVHRHRQNIIRKLGTVNATEAVKTAFMMGIIK